MKQISKILKPRYRNLEKISNPFGAPSLNIQNGFNKISDWELNHLDMFRSFSSLSFILQKKTQNNKMKNP